MFGFDNTYVGRQIGETWKLGNAILDTIHYQNSPNEYSGQYSDIVNTNHVAIYFVSIAEIGFSGDRHPARANEQAMTAIGVEEGYLDEIEAEVLEQIEKAEVFLRL